MSSTCDPNTRMRQPVQADQHKCQVVRRAHCHTEFSVQLEVVGCECGLTAATQLFTANNKQTRAGTSTMRSLF
jgi:hypothetical protein